MQVTLTAGDDSVAVEAVRLDDGRWGAGRPDGAPWLADGADVGIGFGDDHVRPVTVDVLLSGRTWTEVRGRLREQLPAWRRRFSRPPAEVLVLTVTGAPGHRR